MTQQYSSMLFWICLFVACCNVLGNSTTIDTSATTASSAPSTTPPLGTVTTNSGGGGGSSSVSSGGATSVVSNTASGTAASASASSTTSSSGATTPAAKVVNCINGTKTGWSKTQNASSSCQSSTCWVLATYADKEVTQIKLSCAPKEQGTKCDKDECKYANDSCECCCSTDSCNNENFDEKCEGARASSRGVRLSPPWLGLVTLVLVMMKTL
ncbi:P17/29C-like protein DDB_G0287399 [Lingula anatina]|uniref:P17/29C-like protein DDB_G0287399 n=1 Tax=Lingula anatina TaxID=7574 RepID=A0A1S3IH20_LINAN|nr:P17/29C-like protein DDB_G0287399 [Lingula anatina]|eukprot:XP_013397428.1 P17/29C-like protein DDB_G0287399 [Lingula anatina]